MHCSLVKGHMFVKILRYVGLSLVTLFFWSMTWYGCYRTALGSASSCDFIKDADRRHFCRAVSIPRKSECEFIRNSDLRHECRARVK